MHMHTLYVSSPPLSYPSQLLSLIFLSLSSRDPLSSPQFHLPTTSPSSASSGFSNVSRVCRCDCGVYGHRHAATRAEAHEEVFNIDEFLSLSSVSHLGNARLLSRSFSFSLPMLLYASLRGHTRYGNACMYASCTLRHDTIRSADRLRHPTAFNLVLLFLLRLLLLLSSSCFVPFLCVGIPTSNTPFVCLHACGIRASMHVHNMMLPPPLLRLSRESSNAPPVRYARSHACKALLFAYIRKRAQ